jgi:hypothetical protein
MQLKRAFTMNDFKVVAENRYIQQHVELKHTYEYGTCISLQTEIE